MSMAFTLHRSSLGIAETCWDMVAEYRHRRAELPRWRLGYRVWLTVVIAWRVRDALAWEADARRWLERAITDGELTD